MGAVRRSERVVYIDIAVRCELLAEFEVFLLLLPMEAEVFKQNAFAFLAGGDLCLRVCADDVGRKRNLSAEQLVQALCDGGKGELFGLVLFRLFDNRFRRGFARVYLFLVLLVQLYFFREDGVGLAHVRAEHDLCALFH